MRSSFTRLPISLLLLALSTYGLASTCLPNNNTSCLIDTGNGQRFLFAGFSEKSFNGNTESSELTKWFMEETFDNFTPRGLALIVEDSQHPTAEAFSKDRDSDYVIWGSVAGTLVDTYFDLADYRSERKSFTIGADRNTEFRYQVPSWHVTITENLAEVNGKVTVQQSAHFLNGLASVQLNDFTSAINHFSKFIFLSSEKTSRKAVSLAHQLMSVSYIVGMGDVGKALEHANFSSDILPYHPVPKYLKTVINGLSNGSVDLDHVLSVKSLDPYDKDIMMMIDGLESSQLNTIKNPQQLFDNIESEFFIQIAESSDENFLRNYAKKIKKYGHDAVTYSYLSEDGATFALIDIGTSYASFAQADKAIKSFSDTVKRYKPEIKLNKDIIRLLVDSKEIVEEKLFLGLLGREAYTVIYATDRQSDYLEKFANEIMQTEEIPLSVYRFKHIKDGVSHALLGGAYSDRQIAKKAIEGLSPVALRHAPKVELVNKYHRVALSR